MKLTKFCKMLH